MDNFEYIISKKFKTRVAFDSDLRAILKFNNQRLNSVDINHFTAPFVTDENLAPISLRHALFTMDKIIIVLEENNEIQGLVIFGLSKILSVALLEKVIIKKEHTNLLLENCDNLLKTATRYPVTKIRVLTEHGDSAYNDIMKAINVKYIATLEKEYKNNDIDLFDRVI